MNILSVVEPFDSVVIFRHQIADQDALGAQFGLKCFLQSAFPNKKIYAIGNSVGSCFSLFPEIDDVEDEIIASSIAFVLDTADTARIDDQRFRLAKKLVKIDHHILVENYADDSYVDTHAAATCEILAFLFQKHKFYVTKECATYLYYGLIADSLGFTTNNTSDQTLLAAAFLLQCGVDVSAVKEATSGMSADEFYYINLIRNKVQIKGKVAYAIMNAEEYQQFGLTYNQAKEKVFALANVNEFPIWCLFTEDESYDESKLYNGSLRSRTIAINKVANDFRGGGHKNACGVKKLTLEEIDSLVSILDQLY